MFWCLMPIPQTFSGGGRCLFEVRLLVLVQWATVLQEQLWPSEAGEANGLAARPAGLRYSVAVIMLPSSCAASWMGLAVKI